MHYLPIKSALADDGETVPMATLSKSNAQGIKTNRMHLRLGNPEAYARGMSGMHRAASSAQQALIWDEINRDEMQHHFTRIHDGKTLLAIEPVAEDDDLVLIEMAA
jgi:DNA-binding transcriptional MocR family regulator